MRDGLEKHNNAKFWRKLGIFRYFLDIVFVMFKISQ